MQLHYLEQYFIATFFSPHAKNLTAHKQAKMSRSLTVLIFLARTAFSLNLRVLTSKSDKQCRKVQPFRDVHPTIRDQQ